MNNLNEAETKTPFLPEHFWYNLKECCKYKGLNYKTACNKTWLQPNNGRGDGVVGGRKVWSYKTVQDWLEKTDSMLQ